MKRIAAIAIASVVLLSGCADDDAFEKQEQKRYEQCLAAGGSYHFDAGYQSCILPGGK